MNRTIVRKVFFLAVGLVLQCCAGLVSADAAIANVTQLDGRAYAFEAGQNMRKLAEGDGVGQNAKIVTAKDSSLTLEFTDETLLALGASTAITLDTYHYNPAQKEDDNGAFEFSTSILGGVVRTVTGLIAKRRPRNVSFRTALATIGVRGTHFTAEVQGTSATIILLAQASKSQANAIEVSNQYGRVEIDEAGFGTEIPDAQSPPSPPRKMRTTNSMNRIVRSALTTGRVRIPRSPMR